MYASRTRREKFLGHDENFSRTRPISKVAYSLVGLHQSPPPVRIRRFFCKIRLKYGSLAKFRRSQMLLPDVKNAQK